MTRQIEGMIEVGTIDDKKIIACGGGAGIIIPKWLREQFDIEAGDTCTLTAYRGTGCVEIHAHFDKTKIGVGS